MLSVQFVELVNITQHTILGQLDALAPYLPVCIKDVLLPREHRRGEHLLYVNMAVVLWWLRQKSFRYINLDYTSSVE